jgi:UV DNA damage endonuclease
VKKLALDNIRDLLEILKWNEAHGIRLFRITSNLFPHMGNEAVRLRDSYFRGDMRFAAAALREAGDYAARHGHRLTFHMNPYIQLGTPNPDVLRRSVFDVVVYGKILQAMNVDDACIVLHGGGVYDLQGDKQAAKLATLARWLTAYRRLPASTRSKIVIENDELHYGVDDLLPFCEKNGIPFCFDIFHNSISAARVEVTPRLVHAVFATWPRGMTPKFHLSEQQKGGRFGAHADMVRLLPAFLCRIRRRFDIMIEAKHKERAVMYLYKKYFKRGEGARVVWKLIC